jgi:polyhydroxyalkanoate synthesis regulator phasin
LVKAGKLTTEQANAKMAAIKKTAQLQGGKGDKLTKGKGPKGNSVKGDKGKGSKGDRGTNYKGIWAKLQALVKAGKLTTEQANAKMAAIKKTAQLQGGKGDKGKGSRGK